MSPRLRAVLALLLYVGIGLGTPMADALVGHAGAPERAHHIEAAGETGCHAGECVLDAPGAPQSPATSPVGTPPAVVPVIAESSRAADSEPLRTTVPGPLGARAPPHSD